METKRNFKRNILCVCSAFNGNGYTNIYRSNFLTLERMKTPLKRIPLAYLIRAWNKKLKVDELRGTFNEELYLKIIKIKHEKNL